MHVRTTRRPGESGTQKLVAKYGDKLVALRYRYDATKKKRYKTIELIVAEEDWTPPPPHEEEDRLAAPTHTYTSPVPVRIQYFEKDLQRQLKSVGGTWDPGKKLWYAPEDTSAAPDSATGSQNERYKF